MANTDKNRNNFKDNLTAYGIGLTNLPVDVFRYGGLAGNLAMNAVGLRDNKTAKKVHDWFQSIENPLDTKGYQKTNPEMFKLGEIMGDTLGLAKAVSLSKGASKYLPRYLTKDVVPAVNKAIVIEAVAEPSLDRITKY